MWKQNSRVQWLKEGDSNSKFFHVKASNKRRKNRLTSLVDEEGVRVENEKLDDHVSYF